MRINVGVFRLKINKTFCEKRHLKDLPRNLPRKGKMGLEHDKNPKYQTVESQKDIK